MTENKFNAAEHFGEKLSKTYDSRIREIFPSYEYMHQVAYSLLAISTFAGAKILVGGVGTGHEAIIYAQNSPDWQIVGFDPSGEMLAIAKEKIKALNLQDRIRLIEGTIVDIDSGQVFDVAISVLVMQFLNDNGEKQRYLTEISNRLRKNAKIIIIDLEGTKTSQDYNKLLAGWKAQQLASRKDKQQVERDFNHIAKNLTLVSEERLRELLANAGFTDVCKFYQSLLLGGYMATKC